MSNSVPEGVLNTDSVRIHGLCSPLRFLWYSPIGLNLFDLCAV